MAASIPLSPQNWQETLERTLKELMKTQKQVVFCITGKSGSGKSTLGKKIRKEGLGSISRRQIAVVDDSILAVPFLGIFTRRIKSKSLERDNLAPFEHWLRKKKLVIYVNVSPHKRLDRCDVILRLRCPEEVRRVRLINREKGGEARFLRTVHSSDDIQIEADHVFDLCLVETHGRAPLAWEPSAQAALSVLNWASLPLSGLAVSWLAS
ncbi:Broad-specificity NMP kinase [Prosthecobacter debontii]|uniref:Broad-specificity NMP kinase n=1 Tax=Prosthecobacter debontii TaxID=48467 RepID=A0A1T4X9C7_9BACT|nr:AAA family ATPase [Prosthecobacter debontii]SKA86047.1 Broad-specificity NMP kinase [Prosthecobacter debontii]